MDLITKGITNLEIIHIQNVDSRMIALLSYQNTTCMNLDINNGYTTVEVPINIRPIQHGIHGGMLVDQSVKNYGEVVCSDIKLIE